MEDEKILALYWARDEKAVEETAAKYGRYCYSIAYNILTSREDAEEGGNDTYAAAWNAMPPHRPAVLSAFLGKLTRRISIDQWRRRNSEKRGGGEVPLVLEELKDCIAPEGDAQARLEGKLLAEAINGFVGTLPRTEQQVFLCRYWYLDSIESIARQFGFSQSKVKSMLHRTRGKLRTALNREGFL